MAAWEGEDMVLRLQGKQIINSLSAWQVEADSEESNTRGDLVR